MADDFEERLKWLRQQASGQSTTTEPPAKPAEQTPPGAITYGLQVGKKTIGVGFQAVLDGLNDFTNPAGEAGVRSHVRGAAKIIGGLLQMGLSPVAAFSGAVGDTFHKLAPGLADAHVLNEGQVPGVIRTMLDPAGAIGMMLESPESIAKMSGEQLAKFREKAAGYGAAFTGREAVETAAMIAAVVMAAEKVKGAVKGKEAEKGSPPAAKGKTPAAAPAKESAKALPEKPSDLPAITDEEAHAFAQKVTAEPGEPVPPAGTEGPRVFGVNWQRLGQEESVNRAILEVNRQLTESGASTEVSRGVRSAETTKQAARDLQFGLEDVLAIEPGTAVNAETLTAMRGVRDTVGRILVSKAEFAVAGEAAARSDLAAMLAINHEVNLRVRGVTAEAGRTLQSLATPSEATTAGPFLNHLNDLVGRIQGMTDIDKAAGMITELKGTPSNALARFVHGIGTAAKRGKDIVWELYVNSLLSGPATLTKKVLSDGLRAGWEIPERAIARLNHELFFPSDPFGVQAGEAAAMARGFGQGLGRTIRAIHNEGVHADLGTGLGESHAFPKAITAENLGLAGTPLERGVNLMGEVVRAPGTAIGVATDIAKAGSYQMELAAQAVRQAKMEGRTGQAFTDRVGYIEDNPAEFPWIADAAKEASLVNTFTQEMGPAGQGLTQFLNAAHLRAQVPFIRIPWNIVKFGVQSTPPFNVPSLLWGELNAKIKMGGAARETALAQVEMGAAISATFAYFVAQGRCTGAGPRDASLREHRRALGIPPYSCKVGDTWYRYNLTEPIGGEIALVADAAEIWAQVPADSSEGERMMQIGATIAHAFGQAASDKPFFTGIKDVIESIQKPDERANTLAKGWARSIVPALVRRTNQAYWDTTMRETRGPLDALKANVPGWSDTLPPHRNPVTGEPVEFPAALGPDIASPISYREETPDPVFKMLMDNDIRVPAVPWTIDARTGEPFIQMREKAAAEHGIPLTGEQRDRWIMLMTREVQPNGRNLYQALEHLRANPTFQQASGGARGFKNDLVHGLVGEYREAARERLLQENEDLQLTLVNRTTERLRTKYTPQTPALSIGR